MALVLITIAYQSVHAFSHNHFSTHHHTHHHDNHLDHDHDAHLDENHQHQSNERCSICDFHFDFFIVPQEISCRLYFPFKPIPYTYNSVEGNTYFSGSLFALRAPPALV